MLREALGVIAAIAVSTLVVARLASTPRVALMLSDGDSLLPVLFTRSLASGETQDWAMSSVLFVPELVVFGALWSLGLGVVATLLLNGIVNVVLLYLAFRYVAGAVGGSRHAVPRAMIAHAVFAGFAALDYSASRDGLELASLLATTTYYSFTVLAVVLTVGIVAAVLRDGSLSCPRAFGLGAIVVVSSFSNPLMLLWASAPIIVILVGWWIRRRDRHVGLSAVALALSAGGGYLSRLFVSDHIMQDGLGYIDVSRAGESAAYYGDLVGQRLVSPGGQVTAWVLLALICTAIILTFSKREAVGAASRFVLMCGWVLPVAVALASIVLGTHAARYLQPVVFGPVLVLLALPSFPSLRVAGRLRLALAATSAALLVLAAAAIAVPRLHTLAGSEDPDVACVGAWMDHHDGVGAGQFWTVRFPKSRIADPSRLVQVTAAMQPYQWLVNRADARQRTISFLVTATGFAEFDLPSLSSATPQPVVCGRYTIYDFSARPLTLADG